MEKYKTVRLGDVVEIKTGRLDANAADIDGLYPFYTCADIPLRINKVLGDYECILLIGNGANTGKVFHNKGPFNAYQRTYILKPTRIENCRYLYWFLNFKTKYFLTRSIGSATNYIKLGDITRLLIPLYKASEQNSIVSSLDFISSIITKHKQLLNKYDELIKSRFIEMFGDPITNPMGWKKDSIEKFTDIISGYPFDSSKYTETGIKICGGLIIMPNNIQWKDCKYWKEIEGFEDYLLEAKDIVIAMDRPWISDGFKIAEIKNNDLPVLLIQRTARIRCKEINNKYLYWIFNLGNFDKHCKVTGSLVPHISLKDIKSFEIPIPPIELQNDFASFVQQIDKSKFAVQKSLEKAETLYKSLMQQYFA